MSRRLRDGASRLLVSDSISAALMSGSNINRGRRMSPFKSLSRIAVLFCALASVAFIPAAHAAEKKSFKVAWSIYVGWMPWDYAAQSGILKKWADKYGIKIELTQINDYVESINQYTAGQFDGCVMTNMDMLTIPSAGGVDSTALIVGDFSNGNDGVVLKGKGKKLADIKGMPVNLVELSVSHYLLARGLETVGLQERDIKVVNTSDADIVGAYAAKDTKATVTWKPQLSEIVAAPDAQLVFDSSKIPGEIIDLLVVNSATLKDNPKLGKALVGAWYETMTIIAKKDPKALAHMAKASGTDVAGFNSQLATTKMFWTPAEAHAFMTSPNLPKTMDLVRKFSFDHGLLGEGAKTADAVGIEFPAGKTLGNSKSIKMRFDPTYTKQALDGAL
jgi:NitT/TauT family transport system substrate-binding protein